MELQPYLKRTLGYIHCTLFKKMLSKENQTSHKPRPQGSMGSFKSVFFAAVKDQHDFNFLLYLLMCFKQEKQKQLTIILHLRSTII